MTHEQTTASPFVLQEIQSVTFYAKQTIYVETASVRDAMSAFCFHLVEMNARKPPQITSDGVPSGDKKGHMYV